ncbi:MAG: hypothetical protein AAF050_25995, partial [Cyanobacteria bacterium J06649_5]
RLAFQKNDALEFYYNLYTMKFWNYILLELWTDRWGRTDERKEVYSGMLEYIRLEGGLSGTVGGE